MRPHTRDVERTSWPAFALNPFPELFRTGALGPTGLDSHNVVYGNHPGVDLADPEWNTSGVPWHMLYYKDNYPRLQRIKARWDPRNVFRHTLSICP